MHKRLFTKSNINLHCLCEKSILMNNRKHIRRKEYTCETDMVNDSRSIVLEALKRVKLIVDKRIAHGFTT